jgi:hypothetical protein
MAEEIKPEEIAEHRAFLQLHEAELARLRTIERTFAYERACGAIESCCLLHAHPGGFWHDLTTAEADIEDEALYLEWRGLIVKNPEHPLWVDFLNESEVKR